MDRDHRRSLALGGAALLALSLVALEPPRALAQDTSTAADPAPEDPSAAQATTDEPAATDEDLDDASLLSEEELDGLVAPVALYPDALLAQVLVASTYPLDVVKAGRWVEDNAELPEEQRADAADGEGWDPSVSVLAAGFPTVITSMSTDIDQTELLGDAMLTQSDGVLEAVQRMRAQADAMGNLPSNEAQTVTVEGDNITIAPTNPEVVYVPTYDSQAVYTTQATSAPVVVESTSDGFSTGSLVTTGLLAFGAGMLVNEIFDNDDDWYGYWGPGYRPVGWGGGGYVRPYPWGGVGNDIDIDFNRNNVIGNRVDIDRDGNWKPDDRRRDRAKNNIADRRGDGNRGDRPRVDARDRDRAQLKQKLDAKGGGREGLEKLKAGKGGGRATAGNLSQNRDGGKLANRKSGGQQSALSRKGNLTSAKKAQNRGKASTSRANVGNRKSGGGKSIQRGGGGGGKAAAKRKGGGKSSAFGNRGGGNKARAGKARGGKSRGGGKGKRR
ncbi:DUF3300 domain-containing protein [Limibaculum sp. M0105]|uniref:DUF3300 domain-containing protein n=1 Tax=Thermohalobaculum xanthum TaxID=2753746 RepID=A0A8J7M771_9RHOB|nr:DUF3300 domain-containing protein [Thermohalobaculum xanthum]MBK0399546.1 DUF3300 domain-containing protein [Thermohalobaculum xanthum]